MKFGIRFAYIWFSTIIILFIVIGAAIAFTFTDFMDDKLFGTRRVVFIFILVAYGIYRSFRLYQLLKNARNEKEDF